ncbi:MAG: flagellar hook-associated protein FlgK [Candidatus Velthaea sp.]
MSFFGLNIAGNALSAFQDAANVTSDNIANVNTPGASRQQAGITEAAPVSGSPFYAAHVGSPGTRGEGVVVNQIERIHQDSYDALFRGASSSQNFFSVQQQQLASLQSSFGEPNNGINKAFTALQTAVSNLAAQPASIPVRGNVIAAAQSLVSALNQSGSAVQQQQALVLQQSSAVVVKANGLIDRIAALNGQIRAARAVGDNPNTYLDQRDNAIDALSQLISTQTSIQANGSTLVTVNGQALVNDTVAYHLAPPVVGTNANGTPAFKIGFVNDPNPSNPQAVPLGSGQLAGYADVYNNKLLSYGAKLDAFANATAGEIDRVTQAGVDLNANAGLQLLQPVVSQQAVTALNIKVGITDPAQVPAGFVSTSAGTLTAAMNSANNTVDTSTPINSNQTLFNPPPAAGLSGSLTIAVDGISQTFAYSTSGASAGPPPVASAASIDQFITSFNNGHFGVSASFDTVGQKIVFARDPNNIDLVHRALQGTNLPTPGFTISDASGPAGATKQGTPAINLLQALGADSINGVPQTAQNAFGNNDNGAANALVKLFAQNVGVGSLQTTSTTAVAAPGSVTVTQPAPAPGAQGGFATIQVGQLLTVDAGTASQENVVVTAVNRNTGTITATFTKAHGANFSITTAPTQTLGSAYGALTSTMALDIETASTGTAAQTALAQNIDKVRQGVDGINIDEETQNLIKFQNAYAAAARTVNVLDQMLQTVLGLAGR